MSAPSHLVLLSIAHILLYQSSPGVSKGTPTVCDAVLLATKLLIYGGEIKCVDKLAVDGVGEG